MTKKSIYSGSLWNNPMIKQAEKALDPKQKAELNRAGHQIYATIDYETGQASDQNTQEAEVVAYIGDCIKGGLHPSLMKPHEIKLMESAYGSNWLKQFNYTQDAIHNVLK